MEDDNKRLLLLMLLHKRLKNVCVITLMTTQQAGTKNVMKCHPKKGLFLGVFRGSKRGQKMAFFEVRATRSRCVERVKFVVHEQILWCKHIKRDELQRWRRKTSKNRFWADFPGPDTLSGPGKPRKWPFLSTQKSMQQRVEHRSTSSL